MAVAVTAVATSPQARAGTAPPPPSGWTTVFSDNFAGAAGSAPNPQNWFYDIGTGFGTGEIENMTNSTSNVHLDGNGDLDITAIDNGGTWTSGRIESTRDDFEAPPGGEMEMTASIEQPNPADGLGYWPAFWALGSPGRTGGMARPRRLWTHASQAPTCTTGPGTPILPPPAARPGTTPTR